MRSSMQRFPMSWFAALAYLFSWWTAPIMDGAIFPYGPSLAALAVIGVADGRPGLRRWWTRLSNWRVGGRWYLLAIGLIAGYLLVALPISMAFGAEVTNTEALALATLGPLALELALLGGWWEEPGWSGHALPTLQGRWLSHPLGLLKATLILAGIRAIWHLPLVLYGHITWYDAVFLSLAIQLIITWLFNRSGGSVPVVMVAHLTSNVVGGGIMVQLFEEPDRTTYYIAFIATALVLGLLLNRPENWGMGRKASDPSPLTV